MVRWNPTKQAKVKSILKLVEGECFTHQSEVCNVSKSKSRLVVSTNNVRSKKNMVRISIRMSETKSSAEFIPNFWVTFLAKMDDFRA